MKIAIRNVSYTIEDFFSFSKEAIFNMNEEVVSEYKFNDHNLTRIEIKDCLFDGHIVMNIMVVFDGDEMSNINFYRSKAYFESHAIDNSYKEINRYLKTNLKWKHEITLRYKNNLWINKTFKLEHSLIDRFGKEEILSIHRQKELIDEDLHEDKIEIVCRQNITSKIFVPMYPILEVINHDY